MGGGWAFLGCGVKGYPPSPPSPLRAENIMLHTRMCDNLQNTLIFYKNHDS